MKHDELKDAVYWHWRYVQGNDGLQALTDYRRAILAVVELHTTFKPEFGGGIDYCWADDRPYPCPTIQAIEKELA